MVKFSHSHCGSLFSASFCCCWFVFLVCLFFVAGIYTACLSQAPLSKLWDAFDSWTLTGISPDQRECSSRYWFLLPKRRSETASHVSFPMLAASIVNLSFLCYPFSLSVSVWKQTFFIRFHIYNSSFAIWLKMRKGEVQRWVHIQGCDVDGGAGEGGWGATAASRAWKLHHWLYREHSPCTVNSVIILC